ncbi:MAG: hypothetical protein OXG74_05040 [Acidobacteria bacterium]|nr:hypothetical protein [Acidobacteriota bacterium]
MKRRSVGQVRLRGRSRGLVFPGIQGKLIYMSRVMDPYQPIERRLRLTG